MEIEIQPVGEKELPPLSDYTLSLICDGLEIANQGAAKSMAHELLQRREAEKNV